MNIWISDVVPVFSSLSPPRKQTWAHMELSKHTATHHIYVNLHASALVFSSALTKYALWLLQPDTHTYTFIHSLLSVTYHLPLDFWTSLLLKLCDLAVHTVAQKTAPRRSSGVCAREKVRKASGRDTACTVHYTVQCVFI